ncbi:MULTISPECIES: DivIVA domain-containing protein [unclassified Streptomyces]|uniref:DivIVA domain-containing protein n=1 Tax=unclassified Streptomyces TaxID=2593676 RepID=UPI0022B6532E|nr:MULTISPECIES: DivIVA domain-containing protein [unclassified Streptomyces]MCZ7416705.1 DivIVA domain-containing protein [Streptomyces sp. WMMC897]MCZ7433485.1 DivIVA domain-containing protein [Streptomyces sp. WMMC1477]
MFWFLLLAMLVVVGSVTLAVVGGADGTGHTVRGGLTDPAPDRPPVLLPHDRPLARADVTGLRLPLAVRGYRMAEVDDVLDRLGAELAERDARIAELESALAGSHATALSGPELFGGPGGPGGPDGLGGPDAESEAGLGREAGAPGDERDEGEGR